MSNFYNHRSFGGGPIAKKPRLGPRNMHPTPVNYQPDENGGRLLSFKEFIISQSNDINEQEALAKYADYKTTFTRNQIDKFFKAHQEEEWFKNKYRPAELKKIQEASKESKAKRKKAYKTLVEKQNTENFFLDEEHRIQVSQFLENLSLLLEGASPEELDDPIARRKYEVSTIFIPRLHPSIDKSVIEEHAAKDKESKLLRVACSEARADQGFERRAWITYRRMSPDSLQELCWNLNTTKFDGHEVNTVINKDMNNRIKSTKQLWSCHSEVAKADLKNMAKLLIHFDGEDCALLESIKDYLIDEINGEEQILGVDSKEKPQFEFTQNPDVLKALDHVILYLRAVHSFDYYATTEYTGEDDMPQKLGILYVRPAPPASNAHFGSNPNESLREFIEGQKARVNLFLERQTATLSETEQKQLGSKNSDEEVESFIYQHTVEKKPGEKYVCKLTKKKFVDPKYVRQHIINRCGDKLDEVRAEVEFFNNYVADPYRPMNL